MAEGPGYVVMMGTGTFAEPTFRALLESKGFKVVGLVTQPDRAVGDKRGSTRQVGDGMKNIALAHGIPVLQPESINTPEGVAALKQLQPDMLVVAAYGQILSREVLEVAPLGGVNVHASLLPKYRGAAPIAWAIYHGETQSGVTIIRMSTALDAGDILAQEAIDILPDETAGELEARLGTLGAQLLMKFYNGMAGDGTGVKQDKALVSKAPKLTKEMGLINWSRPASAVVNQVRAMSPWPTAYAFLHQSGQPALRFIVHRAVAHPSSESLPPGQVIAPSAEPRFLVAAAEGAVEILELQPAGKRRMQAVEFLRGRLLHAGNRVGGEAP